MITPPLTKKITKSKIYTLMKQSTNYNPKEMNIQSKDTDCKQNLLETFDQEKGEHIYHSNTTQLQSTWYTQIYNLSNTINEIYIQLQQEAESQAHTQPQPNINNKQHIYNILLQQLPQITQPTTQEKKQISEQLHNLNTTNPEHIIKIYNQHQQLIQNTVDLLTLAITIQRYTSIHNPERQYIEQYLRYIDFHLAHITSDYQISLIKTLYIITKQIYINCYDLETLPMQTYKKDFENKTVQYIKEKITSIYNTLLTTDKKYISRITYCNHDINNIIDLDTDITEIIKYTLGISPTQPCNNSIIQPIQTPYKIAPIKFISYDALTHFTKNKKERSKIEIYSKITKHKIKNISSTLTHILINHYNSQQSQLPLSQYTQNSQLHQSQQIDNYTHLQQLQQNQQNNHDNLHKPSNQTEQTEMKKQIHQMQQQISSLLEFVKTQNNTTQINTTQNNTTQQTSAQQNNPQTRIIHSWKETIQSPLFKINKKHKKAEQSQVNTGPCPFHQRGTCKFGEQCRHSHE